jgi:hypothetical protein
MKKKAAAVRSITRIGVAAGQCYRVPRAGKPARHVVVARVTGKNSNQPKALIYEVTRGGVRKDKDTFPHWLQWDQDLRVWGIGPGMEPAEIALAQAA